jgi:hypothetical protein
MRYCKVLTATALALAALSCGGDGPIGGPDDALARVGEEYITEQEFREVFSGLSPEQQVAVLDPGGRMSLVDRLIKKRLLEMEAESTELPDLEWWRSVYADTDLATRYTESMMAEARQLAMDTTREVESEVFRMDIVLVEDSAAAAAVAAQWVEEGPARPDTSVMALAPWSDARGSYRTLENYVELMPVYLQDTVLDHAGEGVSVEPLFGVYAVFDLEVREAETPMRSEDAIPAILAETVYSGADVRPRSAAIRRFAGAVRTRAGAWDIEEAALDPGDTLVTYSGGALTAGEAALFVNRLRRENFLSEPTELTGIMPPSPSEHGGEVAVWMYLTGLAKMRWQADRAREQGMEADSGLSGMARVEHMLRVRITDSLASAEDAELESFYEANMQHYTVPERRSVLRADIPPSDTAGVAGLSSLGEMEATGDSAIRLSLSPLLPEGAFGPIGDEVFAADTVGVHGPVVLADTLPLVYFEVVRVSGDSVLPRSELGERLRMDYVAANAGGAMEGLLMELREKYDVEIDSTAVRAVDPW